MTAEVSGSSSHPGRTAAPDRLGLSEFVLAIADDALISAQRMGQWIAAAPQIEEDLALGNIGLDLLGQARSLLSYAGSLTRPPRTEDELAYFRDERDFRNVQLVERDPGDFGVTMARLLFLATYQHLLYSELRTSTDETLAAVAAKAVKEVDYHCDHAMVWVLRLGDGTEESHGRMQAALVDEWPYVEELFETGYIAAPLLETGVAVDVAKLRRPWLSSVRNVVERATLTLPDVPPAVTGGRRGIHTEQMGRLLAEMQHLARSHPGATW